jgi:hypothetical protein
MIPPNSSLESSFDLSGASERHSDSAKSGIDKLLYYAGRLGIEANRNDINSKIEEGHAAAQRGEVIEADEVRLRIADRKHAPLSE